MSDRKIGNNKAACKVYASAGRLEKNKARRKATQARRVEKIAARVAKRIKLGKTVNKRHRKEA